MKKLIELGGTQAKQMKNILYEEHMRGHKIASKFSVWEEPTDDDWIYPRYYLTFKGNKVDYDFYGAIMYRLGMWMQVN